MANPTYLAIAIAGTGDFHLANKIVGEEDKGGIITAATSLCTRIPFGLARWYPSGLSGQIEVNFQCEYYSGKLYLNGVEEKDNVIIVDDMISTGGTIIALIDAINKAKANVVDIICVAEKVEYEGVNRVKRERGYDVKTLVKVSIAAERTNVLKS